MTTFRLPGPVCRFLNALQIDSGTLCRAASSPPGVVGLGPQLGSAGVTSNVEKNRVDTVTATAFVMTTPEKDVYGKKKYVNAKGNTECVEFVRQTTNAPATSLWRKGVRVKDASTDQIARFTAIATFNAAGRYPTDDKGMHAAIYLSHSKDSIEVLDQWNGQGEVKKRTIRFDRDDTVSRSNNGDTFYVISVD